MLPTSPILARDQAATRAFQCPGVARCRHPATRRTHAQGCRGERVRATARRAVTSGAAAARPAPEPHRVPARGRPWTGRFSGGGSRSLPFRHGLRIRCSHAHDGSSAIIGSQMKRNSVRSSRIEPMARRLLARRIDALAVDGRAGHQSDSAVQLRAGQMAGSSKETSSGKSPGTVVQTISRLMSKYAWTSRLRIPTICAHGISDSC